jgi:hypothetical protein
MAPYSRRASAAVSCVHAVISDGAYRPRATVSFAGRSYASAVPQPPKPPTDAERQAVNRKAEPEEVRYSRESLPEYAGAFFDSDAQSVAAALALEPSRKTFTQGEVTSLLKELGERGLDPYAGVPETYVKPDAYRDEE